MNPLLIIFIATLIAIPVITYRKTGSVKKTALVITAILLVWVLLGQFAHLSME